MKKQEKGAIGVIIIFLAVILFGPMIRKKLDEKIEAPAEIIKAENGYVSVAFIINGNIKAEQEKIIKDVYMCADKTKFEVHKAYKKRAETITRIQEMERDLKQLRIEFEKDDVNPSEYDYIVYLSKGEEGLVEKQEGNKLWVTYKDEPELLCYLLRDWCGLTIPVEGLRVISKD